MASLAGYVDGSIETLNGYGTLVDAVLELVPELMWPQSVRTFARMRHDPQLAAILKAYTLPIRRASWAVDPHGSRPEIAAQIADDLGLPVLGSDDTPSGARRRGVDWFEHLRLALLDLTFGYMPFEQLWEPVAGQFRLTALAERMPQTIDAIKIDGAGQITSIEQRGLINSDPVTIPAKNLVWYANDREGAAWHGQSLLRPSFPFWLLKDEVLRVHATSLRRFGMGIPVVHAPPGATPQQVAEARRIASNLRSSEKSGLGLPEGFTAELVGLSGSVPDAVAFINYLDRQMTRSTLTSILDMATAERGSRSLGQTVMDMFTLALQATADSVAGAATAQIVVPLVTANYGEDEPAPQIVCGDVGAQNQVTAESLNQLLTAGAIVADPALDSWSRTEWNLPQRTTPWTPPRPTGTTNVAAAEQLKLEGTG